MAGPITTTLNGGNAGSSSFPPDTQIGLQQHQLENRTDEPYQAERPDMDSDADDVDDERDGPEQQARAEDPGEEFNARE